MHCLHYLFPVLVTDDVKLMNTNWQVYTKIISAINPLFDSLPQLPRLYTLMAAIMERNITY